MGKKNKKGSGDKPKENDPPKDNKGDKPPSQPEGSKSNQPEGKKDQNKKAQGQPQQGPKQQNEGSQPPQGGRNQQQQGKHDQKRDKQQSQSQPQQASGSQAWGPSGGQPGNQGGRNQQQHQQQQQQGRQQQHQNQPQQPSGSQAWGPPGGQAGNQGGRNQQQQQGRQGQHQQQQHQNQPQQPSGSQAWGPPGGQPGNQGGRNQQQQQGRQGQHQQQQHQNQPQQPSGSQAWGPPGGQPGNQGGRNQQQQQQGRQPQQGRQQQQQHQNQPQQPSGSQAWGPPGGQPGNQGGRNQQQQQGRQGQYQQQQQQNQPQQHSGSQSWGQPGNQGGRNQQQQGRQPQQGRQQPSGPYNQPGGSSQTSQSHQSSPSTTVSLSPQHEHSPARGTRGIQHFELQTNYLTLDLEKMSDVAYHYDVKIDPDRPKKFLRTAFDQYVKTVFPNHFIAYDGKANAYSPILLSETVLNANQEKAVIVAEGTKTLNFKVTLKPTDDVEVDLNSLKRYHKERIFDKPMRALQCIEVVLSTPCHDKGVRAGRSFFKKPDQTISLGDGFELWLGLYQAAMLCDQPLLNVDVSHKSFPSKVNLLDLYLQFGNRARYALPDYLKGLRLNYVPPPCFKAEPKGFKFVDIKRSSSEETFKNEDGKTLTVEQYFASKGYKLKRPDLPCLHVGSTVKNIYIPIELLEVPEGQAIMRKDNENQVRQMIRFAATSTVERKRKIEDLLRYFNYNLNPTVQRFGISVGNQFITIKARLLESPVIQYGNSRVNIARPGEWMLRRENFLQCDTTKEHKWAIINISQKREITMPLLKQKLVGPICSESTKLGMKLSQIPEIIEPQQQQGGRGRFNRPDSILEHLRRLKKNGASIVFVLLPSNPAQYAAVKKEAELQCGIVTQCIKGDTIYSQNFRGVKEIDLMTINNILLKVNAKLNGINHKIADQNKIPIEKSKIMFVGADVSHPSPLQKDLPSIVGVVASHDLNGTQYNMQYRLQTARVETIEDMKNIFTQHLIMFQQKTGSLPDNVIYYRDGVSDGQFPLITKIEIAAMRTACKDMKCNPKFTVIIVVKRHHTRFFPKPADGEGKFMNVKAGTIVDQTICHPNEVQFFLCSHKAIQGTSKPTRYNVIVDDAKINIDDLQALTYHLCHLFPRCNRSVSYPAPAYLAHLVGLRGRAYIEGERLNLQNLKAENSKRLVSQDLVINPMHFV